MNGIDWQAVAEEAVGYLQALLRIDTTNPPGNEQAAAEYLAEILGREGLEPTLISSEPRRTSVVARLPGRGERGPLLLQGHTDVVPADPSEWRVPPFSGEIADGCIWGRGALDMKGTVVMQLMAMLLAKRLGLRPAGDVILAAVADEEMGGRLGAGFLVDDHPDRVRAEYALGEVGGFSLYIGNSVFYPIQVTEKDGCGLTITAHGASGHGSQPIRDGAMAIAGRVLERLTSQRLPLHILPIVERFIRAIAQEQPELLGLLDPERSAHVLAEMGTDGRMYEAITHNTAAPTILQGGAKSNVIPGSVTITVDGRTLPGQSAESFVQEVKVVLKDELSRLTIEPRSWTGGPASLFGRAPVYEAPTDAFFDQLGGIIEAMEPGARPVPYLVSGGTDARHFARLGTKCYGFAPVRLRRDMAFWTLFHSADERLPLDGLRFGLEAVYRAVEHY